MWLAKFLNFNKPSKKFPNETDAKLFTIQSKLPISAYPGFGDPISWCGGGAFGESEMFQIYVH